MEVHQLLVVILVNLRVFEDAVTVPHRIDRDVVNF